MSDTDKYAALRKYAEHAVKHEHYREQRQLGRDTLSLLADLDTANARAKVLEAECRALAEQVLVLAATDLAAPADVEAVAQYVTEHKSGNVVYVNAAQVAASAAAPCPTMLCDNGTVMARGCVPGDCLTCHGSGVK